VQFIGLLAPVIHCLEHAALTSINSVVAEVVVTHPAFFNVGTLALPKMSALSVMVYRPPHSLQVVEELGWPEHILQGRRSIMKFVFITLVLFFQIFTRRGTATAAMNVVEVDKRWISVSNADVEQISKAGRRGEVNQKEVYFGRQYLRGSYVYRIWRPWAGLFMQQLCMLIRGRRRS
jgi:hypothetical protein